MVSTSTTVKTYRFPINGATGGAAELERAQGYASTAGQAIARWFAGPWGLDSWVAIAVFIGGVGFQIGFVAWFSNSRPRGPEDVHGTYSFLAWLLMSFILAVQAVPYLLFAEPFIGKLLGASVAPVTGRKPLLIVLNVVATTVLLMGAVLPAVDGNYYASSPYLYIAAESAFMTGWLFGLVYSVVMAMSIKEYSLAHLGLTPSLVALMFTFAALAGAAMVMDWMQRCNTGEVGGGPWDGCTGAMAGDGSIIDGHATGGSSGGGTSGCPCPNAAGTKCNCPFDNSCNIQSACYNPGGGHIPSGCKMGCGGFG